MTTLDDVTKKEAEQSARQKAAVKLVRLAQEQVLSLTGPDGLLNQLAEKCGQQYPAVIRLWDNACNEFIPFLDYDVEIRRVICSTNAVESLNHPTGVGRARWTMRWKPAPTPHAPWADSTVWEIYSPASRAGHQARTHSLCVTTTTPTP